MEVIKPPITAIAIGDRKLGSDPQPIAIGIMPAVIAIVVALLAAAAFLGLRRRPRQDDGVQTFRRHIDALSPEARREVIDRARRNDARGTTPEPGGDGQGTRPEQDG